MNTNDNSQQELIISFLSGEASNEEIDSLNEWIETSAENKQQFNEYLRAWQAGSWSELSSKSDVDIALEVVNERILQRKRAKTVKFIQSFAKYAAVIFLFVALSFFVNQYWQKHFNQKANNANQIATNFSEGGKIILQDGTVINLDEKSGNIAYNQKNGKIILNNKTIYANKAEVGTKKTKENISYKRMVYNTIIVPFGHYYKITVPDSTMVWINSGSKLKYYSDIPNDIRLIELQGEAYFEVTHNKNVPFIVKTNDQEVKVLGTAFNINSQEKDNFIKTTLVTGSLQITGNKDKKSTFSIKIKPGEQAVYSKMEKIIEVRKVNAEVYCSWKDGYYTFMDTPFREVIETISRYYGVEIVLQGEAQNFDKKISGKLVRDNTITQTLDKIKLLLPFEYKFSDKKIIIYSVTN